MKIMTQDPQLLERVAKAFHEREVFRLEGAGLSVPYIAVSYGYTPDHFDLGLNVPVTLELQQLEEAKFAPDEPAVPDDTRLHQIRNACSEIHQAVEHYNVSIECSAAMRAVIEAMIDAGYRKP